MRVVFVGPPGAGKGTQAEWLVQYLSIPHLSTGDMLRQAIDEGTDVGRTAREYVSSGQLVPDEVVIEMVGRRLEDDDLHDPLSVRLGRRRRKDDLRGALRCGVRNCRNGKPSLAKMFCNGSKMIIAVSNSPGIWAMAMKSTKGWVA